MDEPKTVPALIDAFGGPTDFARAIGLKNPSTASEMKRNASIRVSYWPAIVDAAPAHHVPGVTLESIAQMHLEPAAPQPEPHREASR
jgi:hypothetical protein